MRYQSTARWDESLRQKCGHLFGSHADNKSKFEGAPRDAAWIAIVGSIWQTLTSVPLYARTCPEWNDVGLVGRFGVILAWSLAPLAC